MKNETTKVTKRAGQNTVPGNHTPATTTASQGEAVKRGRGSPKGVEKGPRKIIFVGFAVDENGDAISEEMIFSNPEEATTENAAKQFEEKHQLVPVLRGPFYEVKKAHTGGTRRAEAVSIPLTEIDFTGGKRIAGEYNGWHVIGHYLKAHPDKVMLLFGDPVDANAKKRVPSKGMNIVSVSALHNIRPVS